MATFLKPIWQWIVETEYGHCLIANKKQHDHIFFLHQNLNYPCNYLFFSQYYFQCEGKKQCYSDSATENDYHVQVVLDSQQLTRSMVIAISDVTEYYMFTVQ